MALKMMKSASFLLKRSGNSCVSQKCSWCLSDGMQYSTLFNLVIKCPVSECLDSGGK